MPRRFDLGRAVLVAGAALLFISLFLEWYDTGQNGWQVFEALDLVLAGLAVAGIVAARAPGPHCRRGAAWAVPLAAVVIVVVQLIDPPPAAAPRDARADRAPGSRWPAALLMAAGVVAVADEHLGHRPGRATATCAAASPPWTGASRRRRRAAGGAAPRTSRRPPREDRGRRGGGLFARPPARRPRRPAPPTTSSAPSRCRPSTSPRRTRSSP